MLSRPPVTNTTNWNNIRNEATLLLCELLFVDLLGVNARNIYQPVLPPWPTSLAILLTSLFLGKFSSRHIFRNVLPGPLRTTTNSQTPLDPSDPRYLFYIWTRRQQVPPKIWYLLAKHTVLHRKSKCQVNYGLKNSLAFIRKSEK